ncbi:hypothetical protein L9F63_017109, partial [Diploptera punctata]
IVAPWWELKDTIGTSPMPCLIFARSYRITLYRLDEHSIPKKVMENSIHSAEQ